MNPTMVIVDKTVWVDYFRGTSNPETEWLDREAGRQEIGLTDLILCEVLQSVQGDTEFAAFKQQLLEFEVFSAGGRETAIVAAAYYRQLRRQGFTPRKTIDSLIASFCIREGFSLLHRDRDYDAFEINLGLRVVHP